jgi:hypothetical protein
MRDFKAEELVSLRKLATLQSARMIQLIDECKHLAKLDPRYDPDKGYHPPLLPSEVHYGVVCCKGCPDCVGIGIGYELKHLHQRLAQALELLKRLARRGSKPDIAAFLAEEEERLKWVKPR